MRFQPDRVIVEVALRRCLLQCWNELRVSGDKQAAKRFKDAR